MNKCNHEVILIVDDDNLGIVSRQRALEIAREKNLDLVQVGTNEKHIICKVMDYGKYKYACNKKQKNKKHSRRKEVRLRVMTDQKDLDRKKEEIKKFISKGCQVKVSIMMSGREQKLKQTAIEKITQMGLEFEDEATFGKIDVSNKQVSIILEKKKKDG